MAKKKKKFTFESRMIELTKEEKLALTTPVPLSEGEIHTIEYALKDSIDIDLKRAMTLRPFYDEFSKSKGIQESEDCELATPGSFFKVYLDQANDAYELWRKLTVYERRASRKYMDKAFPKNT